jgi:rare lipoprotein A
MAAAVNRAWGMPLKKDILRFIAAMVMILLLQSGCGKKTQVRPPLAAPANVGTQVGMASWYGQPYHGRRAASGEIYDMEKLTAAHRTLPFGTRVRVENLENGRNIELRINDRGPFVEDRIIDVSRAAARALGMLGTGTARVRMEVISSVADVRSEIFAVQVGAFQDRTRAQRLQREMEKRYGTATVSERKGSPVLWRVLVGKVAGMEAADALARRIRSENPDTIKVTLVVRLD